MLAVEDTEDRNHHKKVVIEGKTGARWLPLVESVPHLNNWLNKHPNRKKTPLCGVRSSRAVRPST